MIRFCFPVSKSSDYRASSDSWIWLPARQDVRELCGGLLRPLVGRHGNRILDGEGPFPVRLADPAAIRAVAGQVVEGTGKPEQVLPVGFRVGKQGQRAARHIGRFQVLDDFRIARPSFVLRPGSAREMSPAVDDLERLEQRAEPGVLLPKYADAEVPRQLIGVGIGMEEELARRVQRQQIQLRRHRVAHAAGVRRGRLLLAPTRREAGEPPVRVATAGRSVLQAIPGTPTNRRFGSLLEEMETENKPENNRKTEPV